MDDTQQAFLGESVVVAHEVSSGRAGLLLAAGERLYSLVIASRVSVFSVGDGPDIASKC